MHSCGVTERCTLWTKTIICDTNRHRLLVTVFLNNQVSLQLLSDKVLKETMLQTTSYKPFTGWNGLVWTTTHGSVSRSRFTDIAAKSPERPFTPARSSPQLLVTATHPFVFIFFLLKTTVVFVASDPWGHSHTHCMDSLMKDKHQPNRPA